MEKKRFGPKLKMEGLPKASKAKVNILTLPVAIETPYDTGYGPDNNLKWEMEIELLEHPVQEVLGKMVWQTTAEVIRVEIMNLIKMVNNKPEAKENLKDLLKDLKGCEWHILCDATGQLNLQEI
jgi:hypothetical protein